MWTLGTGSEPASGCCANQSRRFLIKLRALGGHGGCYCVRTALALLPPSEIDFYSRSQGELVFKKEEIEFCGSRCSADVNWQKCIDCTGYFALRQPKMQPHACFIQQQSTTSTGICSAGLFSFVGFFLKKNLFINQTRKYKKTGFVDLVYTHAK